MGPADRIRNDSRRRSSLFLQAGRGFALETRELIANAEKKLAEKGLDMVVANDALEPGAGFSADTNRVTILDAAGGRAELALMSKRAVADEILDRVARALDDPDAAAQTG